MTTGDEAAVAAAIAAAVAAFGSLVSAWYSRRVSRQQADATDYSNCLETVRQLAEAERKVRDADAAYKEFEFLALFNLMEALAALVNDNKVPTTTLKFVRDYLTQAWAWLRGDEQMAALMQKSITGPDTFAELLKFAKKNSLNIEGLTAWYHGPLPPVA